MASADAALGIAEAIINGNITQTTHTSEVQRVRLPTEYLPLKNGPVISVSSVTVGESDTVAAGDTDGFTVEAFGLRRKYPYTWPTGKIAVTYVTGWDAGARPSEVDEALTMLTTWVDSEPELNISRIDIGDESVTRREGEEAHRPPDAARKLLQRWVKPHA